MNPVALTTSGVDTSSIALCIFLSAYQYSTDNCVMQICHVQVLFICDIPIIVY